MEEERRKRAARFGIPIVEASVAAASKAERNNNKGGGKKGGGGGQMSEEDKARVAARAARFGMPEVCAPHLESALHVPCALTPSARFSRLVSRGRMTRR